MVENVPAGLAQDVRHFFSQANVAAGVGARPRKSAIIPSKAAVRSARCCGKSASSGVVAEGEQTGEACMGESLRRG